MPISVRGAAAPRTRASEVLCECFASVDQRAGAQAWFDTARFCIVAGYAVASSVTMWPFLSRAFAKNSHIVTCR